LRAVLLGAREGDEFEVGFNGTALEPAVRDHGWKDRQIHSPGPQPNMCGLILPQVDPNQELLRLDFVVPPELCHVGENEVSIRIRDRIWYGTGEDISVEKFEVHVAYCPRGGS